MTHRYQLGYYYVSSQDSERIAAFRAASGDSEKTLVTQYVRGWLGRNRSYYLDLAELDAKRREMSFPEWAQTIVEQSVEHLSPYVKDMEDDSLLSANPLASVALPPDTEKRNLNYIELATQNLALLKIAIHYDRDNAIGFVSRIVKEHLQRNWHNLYLSQVEAEDYKNWKFRRTA